MAVLATAAYQAAAAAAAASTTSIECFTQHTALSGSFLADGVCRQIVIGVLLLFRVVMAPAKSSCENLVTAVCFFAKRLRLHRDGLCGAGPG
jgi:hypothetical protein